VVADKTVSLIGGASQIVSYDIKLISAGTHTIDINGNSLSFQIKEKPFSSTGKDNTWRYVIIGIITFVVSCAMTFLIVRFVKILRKKNTRS